MAVFSIIPTSEMTERFDAEFYTPNFLVNDKKLKSMPHEELSEILQNLQLGYTGPTEKFYEIDGINYLSSKNIIDGNIVITDATDTISTYAHRNDLKKTAVQEGDVLISRTGSVGKSAIVTKHLGEANIAAHLIALRIKKGWDSYYLSAFLNSFHGRQQSQRHQRGTIIQGLSVYDVPLFYIPIFSEIAQKYIGDKVRQAEQLRAWAMALELKFQKQLKTFYPEAFKDKSTGKKHSMAPIEDMSYTLNPGAFDEERLRIRLYLKKCGAVKLKEVASIEGTTSSDYSQDTTYIGLDSISSETCALSLSNIRKSGVTGTSRVLNEGVVVAKLRPYLNKISYIPKSLSGSVGSTELLCVRPLNELNGWYIYGVLKSDIGLRQLKPLASGSTHPRIDQYDLYDLIFPIHQDSEIMGKWLENAQAAYFMASYLMISAKSLVEALIEGQLTEEQLIQAQQALEDGDNTLDKSILSKLSKEGYAVEGAAPQFSDIDELYRLLASATADDSED